MLRAARSLHPADWHWLLLYAVILGGWAMIFVLAIPPDLIWGTAVYGLEFWIGLCAVTPENAGFGELLAMWSLMAVAMMLPTALPLFATYDDLRLAGTGSRHGFLKLATGFVLVWMAYALVMAAIQKAASIVLPSNAVAGSASNWLAAIVLAAAGSYQFLPVKDACLAKCRSPLMFLLANWRDGPFNELNIGLRMGMVCVGCCWLLMSVSLVAGAFGLVWMGLATVLMCMEKLPDIGRLLSRPLGVALFGAAAVAAFGQLFMGIVN